MSNRIEFISGIDMVVVGTWIDFYHKSSNTLIGWADFNNNSFNIRNSHSIHDVRFLEIYDRTDRPLTILDIINFMQQDRESMLFGLDNDIEL